MASSGRARGGPAKCGGLQCAPCRERTKRQFTGRAAAGHRWPPIRCSMTTQAAAAPPIRQGPRCPTFLPGEKTAMKLFSEAYARGPVEKLSARRPRSQPPRSMPFKRPRCLTVVDVEGMGCGPSKADAQLFKAVQGGDAAEVARLLAAGASPDAHRDGVRAACILPVCCYCCAASACKHALPQRTGCCAPPLAHAPRALCRCTT